MKEVQILSNYQRFISYIYEYKNQEKAQNCGFCKVEFRNQNCRLEIHMKPGPYPYNPEFQVYTFIYINDKLQGIELGTTRYQQGSINDVFSFSETELISGYCLKDLGGIFIQSDTGQIFASAWKDYEICPDCFITKYESTQELPIHAASIEPERFITHESITNIAPPTFYEPPQTIVPPMYNESSQSTISPISNEIPQSMVPPVVNEASETPIPPSASPQKIFPLDYWDEFQGIYPQVQPFFDDEIHNILRFSCEDMNYLSSLGFSMTNNRFFQHACDNFHHFLIGFNTENQMPVLAIPGIFSELEHYLAAAFGFPHFKPAHNDRNLPGQFIYWIKYL